MLVSNAPQHHAADSRQQVDDEPVEPSEGFWREFFLHKPEPAGLKRVLASMAPDEMLHQQAHSQQLFSQAMLRIKQAKAPADDIALEVRLRHAHSQATRAYRLDLDSLPRRRPC